MVTPPLTPSRPEDDWDSHWSSYSQSNAWNPAQNWRAYLILERLQHLPPPRVVLDIGCGQGTLLEELSARPRFARAVLRGLEGSATGVAYANRRVPRADVRVCDLMGNADGLEDWSGSADQAVCSEVLEHVDDPLRALRAAARFLAPGAHVVVTVPGGPMSAYDRHIGHRTHFTPASLRQLAKAAGFEVIEASGAGWPFFNLYRVGIIAYGNRLASDVENGGAAGRVGRLLSPVIERLMRLSRRRGKGGWQVVGTLRWPGL